MGEKRNTKQPRFFGGCVEDDVLAQQESDTLREQVRIDKPRVFQGGVVEKRYFCEVAHYLKLMYAGTLVPLFPPSLISASSPYIFCILSVRECLKLI